MIRHNQQVLDFREAAERFCSLLETDRSDRQLWIAEILSAVADLYFRAHTLRSVELDLELDLEVDIPGDYDIADDDYYQIVRRVHSLLGTQSYYWSYFDPTQADSSSEKPVCGDLADDLADIYRDVKPGLRAWESGKDEYLPSIIFDWRDALFESHWGLHAVDAMRALHRIVC